MGCHSFGIERNERERRHKNTFQQPSLYVCSCRIYKTDIINVEIITSFTCFITDNSMDTIPIKGLPKSVTIIDLRNNNISKLPQREELQKHLEGIDCIDLRNNKIR